MDMVESLVVLCIAFSPRSLTRKLVDQWGLSMVVGDEYCIFAASRTGPVNGLRRRSPPSHRAAPPQGSVPVISAPISHIRLPSTNSDARIIIPTYKMCFQLKRDDLVNYKSFQDLSAPYFFSVYSR